MRPLYRALIVDDQPFVRSIIREMLLQMKCFDLVAEARDGKEAWNLIQQQPFHIVISDIDMPRMDGIELLKRVSETKDHGMAFLMITGAPSDETEREAFKWGARSFFAKPFTFALLKENIEGILRLRRDRSEPFIPSQAAIA